MAEKSFINDLDLATTFFSGNKADNKKTARRKGNAAKEQQMPEEHRPSYRAEPIRTGETKSRRLQLLLTPSLMEALKARAAQDASSVNDTVNKLLAEALGRR